MREAPYKYPRAELNNAVILSAAKDLRFPQASTNPRHLEQCATDCGRKFAALGTKTNLLVILTDARSASGRTGTIA